MIYHELGAEGLQQFLEQAVSMNPPVLDRHPLEEAADKLEAAGLPQIAEIVMKAAGDMPPLEESNPFNPAIDGALHRDWNRQHLGDWTGFMLSDDERIARGRAMGLIK